MSINASAGDRIKITSNYSGSGESRTQESTVQFFNGYNLGDVANWTPPS